MANDATVILLLPWTSDPSRIAELIKKYGSESPEIVLVGYSYGGQTAINTAAELGNLGLWVDKLALVDPVFRSRYWFMRWRSLLPNEFPDRYTVTKLDCIRLMVEQAAYYLGQLTMTTPTLELPTRVGECKVFHQKISVPMGHKVEKVGVQTKLITELVHSKHEDIHGMASVHKGLIEFVT